MSQFDEYDYFVSQEKQFISRVPTLCPDGKQSLYLGKRWRTMDEEERELYKQLASSNSTNNYYNNDLSKELHLHKLRELLLDNSDNNNYNTPIKMPMKRLNILSRLLSKMIGNDSNVNDSTIVDDNKKSKRQKVDINNKIVKTSMTSMMDDETYKKMVDFTTKEVDQTDITHLLSLAEMHKRYRYTTDETNTLSSTSDTINNSNTEYTADETDVSQLLLGLKN